MGVGVCVGVGEAVGTGDVVGVGVAAFDAGVGVIFFSRHKDKSAELTVPSLFWSYFAWYGLCAAAYSLATHAVSLATGVPVIGVGEGVLVGVMVGETAFDAGVMSATVLVGASAADGEATFSFTCASFPCVVNVHGTPPLLNRLSPVAI